MPGSYSYTADSRRALSSVYALELNRYARDSKQTTLQTDTVTPQTHTVAPHVYDHTGLVLNVDVAKETSA